MTIAFLSYGLVFLGTPQNAVRIMQFLILIEDRWETTPPIQTTNWWDAV